MSKKVVEDYLRNAINVEVRDDIWEKIKDEPIAIKTENEKKKTHGVRYSITATAAACAVIVLSVFVARQHNTFNPIQTDPISNSPSAVTIQKDNIIWNDMAPDIIRIAGTFHEVSAEEWEAAYSTPIPSNVSWDEYCFVYSIPKNENEEIKRSGYIGFKESDTRWISVYVSENQNSDLLPSEKIKLSTIDGKEVAIGKNETVIWGQFSANNLIYKFEAHEISDDTIIEMIKAFIA